MNFKQLLKQYVIFLLVGHRPTRPTMAVLELFCRFDRTKTYDLQKNAFDLHDLHQPTDLHYVCYIYYLIRKLYIYLSYKELRTLFVLKYFFVVGL